MSLSQNGEGSSQHVRTQLVGPVLAYLRARGQAPGPLLSRFHLPPEAESLPDLSLPLSTLRALLGAAERTSPKMEAVARRLHVSSRTLQRLLTEHDTSFQEVVDAVRSG